MRRILKHFSRLSGWVYRKLRPYGLRGKGIRMGADLRLRGLPQISTFPESSIVIGESVTLLSSCGSNAVGLNHRVIIRTIARGSKIRVGNRVGISGAAIVARVGIDIGDEVMIGANAKIIDTDFHPLDAEERIAMREEQIQSAPIRIGRRAWIGAGAYILKGVRVGDESVIGAGAVVTKDVPPRTVVAGNPAKVVKRL